MHARTRIRRAVRETCQGSVPNRILLPYLIACKDGIREDNLRDLRDLAKDESRSTFADVLSFLLAVVCYLSTSLQSIDWLFGHASDVLHTKLPTQGGDDDGEVRFADTTTADIQTLPVESILARIGHDKLLEAVSCRTDMREYVRKLVGNADALLALGTRMIDEPARVTEAHEKADIYFRAHRTNGTTASLEGMLSFLDVRMKPKISQPFSSATATPPKQPAVPHVSNPYIPPPAGALPQKQNSAAKRKINFGWRPKKGEACRWFNLSICTNNGQPNHRAHVCLHCNKGGHTVRQCVCNMKNVSKFFFFAIHYCILVAFLGNCILIIMLSYHTTFPLLNMC